MKTDLESIIELLAGRDDLNDLRSSLLDPSSDASRFLEANRQKTRILLDQIPPTVDWRGFPAGPEHKVAPSRFAALRSATFLGIIILSVAAGWGLAKNTPIDSRNFDRTLDDTRRLVERMEKEMAAIRQVPAPTQLDPAAALDAISQVQATLEATKSRIDMLSIVTKSGENSAMAGPGTQDRPSPRNAADLVPPDPALISINAEIAAIRREIAAKEQAQARQISEIRTVLEEVNSVVRRVLSRPSGSTVGNEAIVALVQSLIQNLSHSNANVRLEAVEQLVRLGPLGRACLPTLRQQINRESDPNVRSAIETALTVFGPN